MDDWAVLYMSKIVIRKQFTTLAELVSFLYGAVLYMSKIVIRKQFTTEFKTGPYLQ